MIINIANKYSLNLFSHLSFNLIEREREIKKLYSIQEREREKLKRKFFILSITTTKRKREKFECV